MPTALDNLKWIQQGGQLLGPQADTAKALANTQQIQIAANPNFASMPGALKEQQALQEMYKQHARQMSLLDPLAAGGAAARSTFEAIGAFPLMVLEAGNRAQQAMWGAMLGEKDWSKRFTWPEMERDKYSGQSGLSRATESIKWRFQGKEPWSNPIPPVFRPSGKPDLTFTELLTFEKDPVKRAQMVDTQRRETEALLGKNGAKIAELAVDMVGTAFVAPDVLVGGPLAKLVTHANKAAKTAQAVQVAAKEAKVFNLIGQGTDAAKMIESNDLAEIGIQLMKDANLPDVQTVRSLKKYVGKGGVDAEIYVDPRVAHTPVLRAALTDAVTVDADALLPSAAKSFYERTGKLKQAYKAWWNTLDKPEKKARGKWFREEGVSKQIGLLKKSDKDLGELAKIVAMAGKQSDVLAKAHKEISWTWFLGAEPQFAIPELFHIGNRATHLNSLELAQTKERVAKALAGIERNGESDTKIFDYLNAERERIVSYDIKTKVRNVEYKPSPERQRMYDNLTDKEKFAADEIDKFFEEAADRLGIADTKAYIQGYAPHVFGKDIFSKSIPQEFMGLRVRRNIMFNHLIPRHPGEVEGYVHSIHDALDSYITGYARKVTIQPALDAMNEVNKGMPALKQRYGLMYINEIAGKPGVVEEALNPLLDQFQKQLGWTRPVAQKAVTLTTLLNFGMLTFNVGFVAKQFFQTLNTAAKTSPFHVLKGLGWLATSGEGRAWAKELNLGAEFAKLRELHVGIDPIEDLPKVFKTAVPGFKGKRVGDLLSDVSGFGDSLARGISFAAGMSDYAAKTKLPLDQILKNPLHSARALDHALRISEATQFIYGVSGRNPVLPAIFGGEFSRLTTMFQSFYLKQASFVLKESTDNFGFALDWLLYTGMAQRVAANEMGIDATTFSGVGSTYPSIRWGQPPLASPPVSMLLAAYGIIGDRTDADTHIANFKQLAMSVIPGYLQGLKGYKAYKALRDQGMRVDSTGRLIQGVEGRDVPGLVLGLPLMSSTERRYAERMMRVQQVREEKGSEALFSGLLKALEKGDAKGIQHFGQAIATTGFGPDNPEDRIESMMLAQQFETAAQMTFRNPELMVRSGSLGARMQQNPDLFHPRGR